MSQCVFENLALFFCNENKHVVVDGSLPCHHVPRRFLNAIKTWYLDEIRRLLATLGIKTHLLNS